MKFDDLPHIEPYLYATFWMQVKCFIHNMLRLLIKAHLKIRTRYEANFSRTYGICTWHFLKNDNYLQFHLETE